jgi:hypothetical protein
VSEDPMDVIMDSAALTRERLDRIRETGFPGKLTSFSRKSKTYTRKCQHGYAALKCELCDRERKIEVLDRLCHRQSELLAGIATVLRGDPVEGQAWSHHDLVERTQDLVDEVEVLRRTKTASNSARWSPPSESKRTSGHGYWISRLNRSLDQRLGS